jgi:hypothetical protein
MSVFSILIVLAIFAVTFGMTLVDGGNFYDYNVKRVRM